MNSDINLLANRDKEQFQEGSRVRKARFAAFFALLFVAFSSIASFLLIRSYAKVADEENSLLQKTSLLHDKEVKLLIVNDRLKYISEILQRRIAYAQATKTLAQTTKTLLDKIPTEIATEDFRISKESVAISLSSSSLISLNTVIKNFTDMAKHKEILKSLTMESLILATQTGKYLLTLKGGI